MESIFIFFVVVLFLLAIVDLIVGVSNDAVNFINSATGSKVATRKTIMIIASIGILFGAVSSAGLMEVARKGIFNPELFYFDELMIIFVAVMLTDILLLDVFNTFALPTSTTVSIVFELLGAAVSVSLLKIYQNDESIASLGQYINTKTASFIVFGIFLAIFVAFFFGAVVQYISRLIFSFHIHKRLKYFGGIWAGLATTCLTYFLIIKGLKGSFLKDYVGWIIENTNLFLALTFAFWTIVMVILNNFAKVSVLKLVVLFGTFSLAMAFAGNDLVNFIGVPIAGFESYQGWVASGVAPDELSMGFLAGKVDTNPLLLILAGLIMVLTLWFSKKARSVTETEINLGRQEEGEERFSPNAMSRQLVRIMILFRKYFKGLVPKSIRRRIAKNFEKPEVPESADQPAFDLIRASVNLVVASILIAIATSQKLPLSTTYVSFMVAMGSSLADRAWGRESAVYRIAGVFNVIGGWLLTALVAFTISGFFAFIIFKFGFWSVALLVALAIVAIIRNTQVHKKKLAKKAKAEQYEKESNLNIEKALSKINTHVVQVLKSIKKIYNNSLNGLFTEDQKRLQKALELMEDSKQEYESVQSKIFKIIKKNKSKDVRVGQFYVLAYDLMQDLIESTETLINICNIHVINSHTPLKKAQIEGIKKLQKLVNTFLTALQENLAKNDTSTLSSLKMKKNEILMEINEQLNQQVKGIIERNFGHKNSRTNFILLLETKDIVAVSTRFLKLLHQIQTREANIVERRKSKEIDTLKKDNP